MLLLWHGLCDCADPLLELAILLILHMLDLREPMELGELGGDWKRIEKKTSYRNGLFSLISLCCVPF